MSTKDSVDENGENGIADVSKAAKPGLFERAQEIWKKTGINMHTYPLILKGSEQIDIDARYRLTCANPWNRCYRPDHCHLSVSGYCVGREIHYHWVFDWDNDRVEHRDTATSEIPSDHDDSDAVGMHSLRNFRIGHVLLRQGSSWL